MQDPYVADIGDYVKFSILRALAFDRSLGVAWWLFQEKNGHRSRDGGHREYLERPNDWKRYDPGLFEALLRIAGEKRRDVRAIESSAVLPNATFASNKVPCEVQPFSLRPTERCKWLGQIKVKLAHCNVIFLDPDNGIASEQLRLTRRCAGKSVTIEEIKALQNGDRTLVVYHHQTRRKGGHFSEIGDLARRLTDTGLRVSGALRAKPWSPRVFFILNGDQELRDRAKGIAQVWEGWISWHSGDDILKSSAQPLRERR